jgi:hypothetical protein
MAKATKPASKGASVATTEKRDMLAHEILLSPTIQNAVAIEAWGKFAGATDLGELVKDFREQVTQVQNGDMSRPEAMLYGQAVTLQTLFTNLTRRAANQDHLKEFQAHLTLALKAQSQCRSTLEALAEMKNPRPVSFVTQANISNGPQQINNSRSTPAPAHAGKTPTARNELLEHQHGNTLEFGAQGQAGRGNQKVEAVGAINGAAHTRR